MAFRFMPASARRAFTLVELIVAVTILAVLAGAAVPVTAKVLAHKAKTATREELGLLAEACGNYFQDVDALPSRLEHLLVAPPAKVAPSWSGPYLPGVLTDTLTKLPGYLVDAWSNPYELTQKSGVLTLRSRGPDGEIQTTDDVWVDVDVTPLRRAKTIERLSILNQAILNYNAIYATSSPLPLNFAKLRKALIGAKLLPDDATYASDAWGDAFVADPAGKLPVVRVDSIHLNGTAAKAKAKAKSSAKPASGN